MTRSDTAWRPDSKVEETRDASSPQSAGNAQDTHAGEGSGAGEPASERDGEMQQIISEEQRVLGRVQRTLAARETAVRESEYDYDAALVNLRDQIQEARVEDVPPLVEEMERMQQVAARRMRVTESLVDPASPYFGRLILEEDDPKARNGQGTRRREVLIGRGTFLDPKTGIRIVDWRDAPVSRIYYRYEEGDDYDENFGGREIEGQVLTRRSLSISDGRLRRIGCPQGTFIRRRDGTWRRAGESATRLHGGQGQAMRPESYHQPGKLGVGEGDEREEKYLSEITALIDPRQFDLITQPTSGLVVIQGGAGSGKTTIGLHRLAYLAYQDPKRFRADRMLVVVFNDALVRYISHVLPALGVHGVTVMTYERWAKRLRMTHLKDLPTEYADDTPGVVVRLKKHPLMLRLIDEYAASLEQQLGDELVETAKKLEGGARPIKVWRETAGRALGHRIEVLLHWLEDPQSEAARLPLATRHAVDRLLKRYRQQTRDIPAIWAELLTDRDQLGKLFAEHAPGAFTERELDWAHAWCSRRSGMVLTWREEQAERRADGGEDKDADRDDTEMGVDGVEEMEPATLDHEDDTLLLRLVQRLRGPLARKREALRYSHIFVDEAQDLSPVELAAVTDTVDDGQSVTLAGDVAQRILMDNGFTDWRSVLGQLGLSHIEVEPLKLSYRSSHEILEFASDVLGPLRDQASGYQATRHGAPVELFQFGDTGEAVGFLADALRELAQSEPRASVAVIARYPEQADLYHRGLVHGEVPNLRRIAAQDFPFKPGVDVTDVRQVKGLEFDYVVLVEVSEAAYPSDNEARHLLHIGATRAAHQLWVTTTGKPSSLLPQRLLQDDVE
jgi:DNA helicase-2/ATP-dependent DNA helicase PcrA